jgi:hypothetical protein
MLNDHAPRIRALQKQAAENLAIEEMERRSAPLFWVVLSALIVILISATADHIEHHLEMVEQGEVLVQCLNGKSIELGDALLRCQVKELVALKGAQL